MDINTIYAMCSSTKEDAMMAIGYVENNLDEFTVKQLEYIGYIVHSSVFVHCCERIKRSYFNNRVVYAQYEDTLPEEIVEYRDRVLNNYRIRGIKDI